MIYYFGTFNPIHLGHIRIANEIGQAFKDKVCFVPAYDSPWKPGLKDNFNHRCKMIKLCGQTCSKIEKDLPQPSYTYKTVKHIIGTTEDVRGDGRLQMIVGADQFIEIEKWKNYEFLRDNCFFIVIPRNDLYIKGMMEKGFKYCIYAMNENISSTEVRNGNLSFVTKEVADYIIENKLYKS